MFLAFVLYRVSRRKIIFPQHLHLARMLKHFLLAFANKRMHNASWYHYTQGNAVENAFILHNTIPVCLCSIVYIVLQLIYNVNETNTDIFKFICVDMILLISTLYRIFFKFWTWQNASYCFIYFSHSSWYLSRSICFNDWMKLLSTYIYICKTQSWEAVLL